jgi:hypothetical protein
MLSQLTHSLTIVTALAISLVLAPSKRRCRAIAETRC